MDIHGEFHGQFVSEKGMEEIVKEDTYPYKPNSGQNTEPTIKKSKYGKPVKPVKPRGIDYVKKFTPHTAMEHFLREVLTDESYSNTVAILEDHLMNFVLIGTKHKWCHPLRDMPTNLHIRFSKFKSSLSNMYSMFLIKRTVFFTSV